MMGCSLLFGCLTGKAAALLPALLGGAASAVSLSLRLLSGYLLFCGLIEIMKGLGWPERLSCAMRPLLKRLMPGVRGEAAWQAVTLNLTANLLGLGNAATPTGIEAVRLMDEESDRSPAARRAIQMLLILNATGLQLIPTTVLTLRVAAGSAAPNAVLLPTLACTGLSAAAGVLLGLICGLYQEKRHG